MPPKAVKPVLMKTDAWLPAGVVRVTGDRGSLRARKPKAKHQKKEDAASVAGQRMDVKERKLLPNQTPQQHTIADFFSASAKRLQKKEKQRQTELYKALANAEAQLLAASAVGDDVEDALRQVQVAKAAILDIFSNLAEFTN
ncbi:hypothetical protein NDU88_007644 [Pleurodeles waltl]|uniref:Uncharacterized protein n=1 Tax=Pleurodeles waltl TaxID=8319 RepID=A0AAV7RTG3_PLEWA|nr:hypothetical protein NDU88_007644 [Pleurodeles waltl]